MKSAAFLLLAYVLDALNALPFCCFSFLFFSGLPFVTDGLLLLLLPVSVVDGDARVSLCTGVL